MSAYHSVKCQFRDQECLIAALATMGYDKVEIHETPKQLFDYHGNATRYTNAAGDRANIIVRRNHIGYLANDIGFLKNADGTFSSLISEFDSNKHNATWVDALSRDYAQRKVAKEMKKRGFVLQTKKAANGKTQLQYVKVR